MTDHPIDSVYPDNINIPKAPVRSHERMRLPTIFSDATEVSNTNLSGQRVIIVYNLQSMFFADPEDTESAPNGVDILESLDGLLFKRVSSIPEPSSISLGGVFALAPVTDHFLTGIDTDGTPLHAQPSASNLSDGVTGTGQVVRATSPEILTPTGIVKGDVGLGNVDNTSDATKNAAAATLTNKTINGSDNTLSNLATSMFAANVVDTDGTLTANSDTRLASQKAVKTYVDQIVSANDAMVFEGVIDCSTNPNYPAADRGSTYRVSVAGKIGGGSGPNVEAGDILLCMTDGTASGNHATVGANWGIIQVNIDGAVTLTGAQTLENKTLTSPDINTPDIDGGTADGLTSFGFRSTGAAFDVKFASSEALAATRTVSWTLGDANRSISLAGNLTFAGAFATSGAFALTLTLGGATNVTLPTTGTLATLAGAEILSNKTLTSPVINTATGDFISGLPTGTPNGAADYAIFLDATDSALKKALLDDMPGGGGGGGADPSLPFAISIAGL